MNTFEPKTTNQFTELFSSLIFKWCCILKTVLKHQCRFESTVCRRKTQHQNTFSHTHFQLCESNQHIVFNLRFVIMSCIKWCASSFAWQPFCPWLLRMCFFSLAFCCMMLIFQRKDSEYFQCSKWICTVPFYGMKLLKHNIAGNSVKRERERESEEYKTDKQLKSIAHFIEWIRYFSLYHGIWFEEAKNGFVTSRQNWHSHNTILLYLRTRSSNKKFAL